MTTAITQIEIRSFMGIEEATLSIEDGVTVISGRGVDSNNLFATHHVMTRHADMLGLRMVQELVFLTVPRPQKHRGPQKSPRSNYSILHVFEVPK